MENLYEASFDYHSDVAEDLSFSTGETITVTSKEKGEWWTGETKDGRTGDFPSVFVQPLDGRQKTPKKPVVCLLSASSCPSDWQLVLQHVDRSEGSLKQYLNTAVCLQNAFTRR